MTFCYVWHFWKVPDVQNFAANLAVEELYTFKWDYLFRVQKLEKDLLIVLSVDLVEHQKGSGLVLLACTVFVAC